MPNCGWKFDDLPQRKPAEKGAEWVQGLPASAHVTVRHAFSVESRWRLALTHRPNATQCEFTDRHYTKTRGKVRREEGKSNCGRNRESGDYRIEAHLDLRPPSWSRPFTTDQREHEHDQVGAEGHAESAVERAQASE